MNPTSSPIYPWPRLPTRPTHRHIGPSSPCSTYLPRSTATHIQGHISPATDLQPYSPLLYAQLCNLPVVSTRQPGCNCQTWTRIGAYPDRQWPRHRHSAALVRGIHLANLGTATDRATDIATDSLAAKGFPDIYEPVYVGQRPP